MSEQYQTEILNNMKLQTIAENITPLLTGTIKGFRPRTLINHPTGERIHRLKYKSESHQQTLLQLLIEWFESGKAATVHSLFVHPHLSNFKNTLITVCLSDVSALYQETIFRNVEKSIGVNVKLTWASCGSDYLRSVPLSSGLSFVRNKSRISAWRVVRGKCR